MVEQEIHFEEKYAHEKGFAAHFERFIAPLLLELEEKRLRYLKMARWANVISYTILAAVFYFNVSGRITAIRLDADAVLPVLLLIALAAAPAQIVRYLFEKRSKAELMPAIMKFYKDAQYRVDKYVPVSVVKEFLICPSFNESKGSDCIEVPGKFMSSLLTLKYESGTGKNRRNVVKFQGVAMLVTLPKAVEQPVAVKRDYGRWLNWANNAGSGYDRIELVDPVFEKVFEVFGKDQVQARAILQPDVMELFLRLNFLFSNWKADIDELEKMTRAVIANHNIEEVRDNLKASLMANYMGDKLLLMIKTDEQLFAPVSLKTSCLDLSLIRAVLYQINLMNELYGVLVKQ
jgi:hypothetical protein